MHVEYFYLGDPHFICPLSFCFFRVATTKKRSPEQTGDPHTLQSANGHPPLAPGEDPPREQHIMDIFLLKSIKV
jgi:hypothetical protein